MIREISYSDFKDRMSELSQVSIKYRFAIPELSGLFEIFTRDLAEIGELLRSQCGRIDVWRRTLWQFIMLDLEEPGRKVVLFKTRCMREISGDRIIEAGSGERSRTMGRSKIRTSNQLERTYRLLCHCTVMFGDAWASAVF